MVNHEKRVQENLLKIQADAATRSSLDKLYEAKLLEAFPTDFSGSNYFYLNTFTDDDENDYQKFMKIFNGKRWNEVDLGMLYNNYVQFMYLNAEGKFYYAPTFLKYFFNLKNIGLEFFTYFMNDLEFGFKSQKFSSVCNIKNKSPEVNFCDFEKFNPNQAKLIATFLVNAANLLPPDWHESQQAQRALTNYWGNFLLF